MALINPLQKWNRFMHLQNVSMYDRFYWKGKKYKIFMKKKMTKKAYKIAVYEYPQGKIIDMPSYRQVKLVIRWSNYDEI